MGAGVPRLGMSRKGHGSRRASPRHVKEASWERACLASACQESVMGAGAPCLGMSGKGHGSGRASPRRGREGSWEQACLTSAWQESVMRRIVRVEEVHLLRLPANDTKSFSKKRMIFETETCACGVDFESFEENFSHRCREAELWVGFGESPLTFGITKVYDGAGIYMKGPYAR